MAQWCRDHRNQDHILEGEADGEAGERLERESGKRVHNMKWSTSKKMRRHGLLMMNSGWLIRPYRIYNFLWLYTNNMLFALVFI
jgi:hypothetical protein